MSPEKGLSARRHLSVHVFLLCALAVVLCLCLVSLVRTGWARPGGQISPLLEPLYHVPVHRAEALRLARAALGSAPGVQEGIVTIDAQHVLTASLSRGWKGAPATDLWDICFPAMLDLQKATGWLLDPIAGIQHVQVDARTGQVKPPTLQTGFALWTYFLLQHGLLEKMKQAHHRLS